MTKPTQPPASRASAHMAPLSYADLVYELRQLDDCLKADKPTAGDLNAARMIATTLMAALGRRSPYIRMPLA